MLQEKGSDELKNANEIKIALREELIVVTAKKLIPKSIKKALQEKTGPLGVAVSNANIKYGRYYQLMRHKINELRHLLHDDKLVCNNLEGTCKNFTGVQGDDAAEFALNGNEITTCVCAQGDDVAKAQAKILEMSMAGRRLDILIQSTLQMKRKMWKKQMAKI